MCDQMCLISVQDTIPSAPFIAYCHVHAYCRQPILICQNVEAHLATHMLDNNVDTIFGVNYYYYEVFTVCYINGMLY